MYEAEWRQAPLIAAFIDALPPVDDLVQLPAAVFLPKDYESKGLRDTVSQLWGRTWRRNQKWFNAVRQGVPRRGERHGLLSLKRTRTDYGDPAKGGLASTLTQMADDLIPLDCQNGRCHARFGQKGSFLFRPRNKARKAYGREQPILKYETIMLDGRAIPYLVLYEGAEKKIARTRAHHASAKSWKLSEERKRFELFFSGKGHAIFYDPRRRTVFRINQPDMKF